MSIKVKICGIRTVEAALAAIDSGADYLGFNFVPSSRRFIKPGQALEIINKIKGRAKIVGVFQNADLAIINHLIKRLDLDLVQLHGRESEEYCRRVKGSVIKAFGLPPTFSVRDILGTMLRYSVDMYLVDREKRGEGKIIDLERARKLSQKFPLIFSGGLTVENVGKVTKAVLPHGVDVAGGVETDGAHDIQKIRTFIKNAKGPA